MNRKLATALALALAAPSAFAITLPSTATDVVYVAGATAVDRTLFESLVDPTNGVCETGFTGTGSPSATSVLTDYDAAIIPEVYTSAPSFNATGPSNWAVYCKVKTGYSVAGLVGITVGINKFSGASETGIDPVGGQTAYAVTPTSTVSTVFVDPTSSACSAGTFTASTPTPNDRVAYIVHTSCGSSLAETATANTGQGVIPNIGIADVDAPLFNASTAVKSNLTQAGALTTTFAPIVSKNFFVALQAAQGITGCTNTVAGHTAACMPSLSMAQLRGLLSGKISSVAAFFDGTSAFTAPTATNGYNGATFRICRRGNTSGTQKSFERILFNQGCSKNTPNVVFATNTANSPDAGTSFSSANTSSATPQVHNSSSGGTVLTCVDDANTNSQYAIGITGADQLPVDNTKEFRYIKIAGVAPTVDNVLSGDWVFTTENVVTNAVSPALTGNRTNLLNLVKRQLTVPAVLAKTHIQIAGARFGNTVRPQLTLAPAATDTSDVRPVAPFIRATTNGAAVNNCNELQSTSVIKN